MTIGFVCNPYHRGGITRWMVDLAVAWHTRGEQSWFVVPRPAAPFLNGGNRSTLIDLITAYPESARPTLIAPNVGRSYEFGTELSRAAIYATAIRAAVPAGVPLIVSDDPAAWRAGASLADRHPLIGVLHSDGDNYYALGRQYETAAAAMVCVSQRIANRMRSVLQDPSVPIDVIPCGAPLRPLQRAARESTPRLIWIGRMDEDQKRVSDLPRIAARLQDMNVPFTLEIVGSGPDSDATRRSFARMALGDRVRMRGWMHPSEVDRLLDAADILLLPSNYEGMPMVVMEALGRGCAVVASRVSGIEDYEHSPLAQHCLWVHDVGDVHGAADSIACAVRVPPDVRASSARALAEAEFSLERCMERYAALLSKLAPLATRRVVPLPNSMLLALTSLPVAAQRLARLWIRHHRPRSARAAAGAR